MAVSTTSDGKIAVFADPAYFSSAGIETYARELIMGLAASDLAERVVLVCTRSGWADQLRALTSAAGPRAPKVVTYAFPNHLLRYSWSLTGFPSAERIVGEPVSLAHNPLNRRFPAACNELVTIHDVFTNKLPTLLTWRQRLAQVARLERVAVDRAQHLIADSPNTKRDICELFGREPDDITVVPLGVDHETFRPVRDAALVDAVRLRYGVEGRYVLYVGSLYGRKLGRLLEAFSLFREMSDADVKLVVVGGREIADPHGAPVRARIHELELGEHVLITGYVASEDLPVLMSAADLFVFVSLYEGFGLSVLEAMACGTPIVASNVSSLPEVVGEAGILVPPGDERAIAAAMAEVTADPKLRETLGAQSLARAEGFSWRRTVEETLAVYRRALGDPAGRAPS